MTSRTTSDAADAPQPPCGEPGGGGTFPAVVPAPGGEGFLLVWYQTGQIRIVARRFDVDGNPLAGTVVLAQNDLPIEGLDAASELVYSSATPDDGTIVTWAEDGAIFRRRLGPDGTPLSPIAGVRPTSATATARP